MLIWPTLNPRNIIYVYNSEEKYVLVDVATDFIKPRGAHGVTVFFLGNY